MSVYVHTTVETKADAERATQELLDAGFSSRDIDLIQCRRGVFRHARLCPRSYALTGAGVGAALGAILGSVAFSRPELWLSSSPELSISAAAVLGATFGLIAGGITGVGFVRTVPKLDRPPIAIAVGVHTEVPDVARAAAALKRLGVREVLAGTEIDAVRHLAATHPVVRP